MVSALLSACPSINMYCLVKQDWRLKVSEKGGRVEAGRDLKEDTSGIIIILLL